MITILGHKISLIRPSTPYRCRVYKSEKPRIRYNIRPRVIKEHCGRVIAVCVRLVGGGIRSMPPPATHLKVCQELVEDLDKVTAVGWQLENGNYIWR